MKIILTEAQINTLTQIEQASNILSESIFKPNRLNKMKTLVKRMLYGGIAAASVIAAINKQNIPEEEKEVLTQIVLNNSVEDSIENTKEEPIKDTNDNHYQDMVKAVEEYMIYALKNQGYTLNSTDLKPETLVKVSIESGIDLPFIMAAAHQESCFGATPRAKRTNSVFSEGCYDNGKNVVTYKDANDSVYGYVKLLKNSYLVNGKTINDLLKPGKFVNGVGNRYASDKKYESKVNSIRNRIIKMHPILA
jgi:uncharacterized FlgJ-related protein